MGPEDNALQGHTLILKPQPLPTLKAKQVQHAVAGFRSDSLSASRLTGFCPLAVMICGYLLFLLLNKFACDNPVLCPSILC